MRDWLWVLTLLLLPWGALQAGEEDLSLGDANALLAWAGKLDWPDLTDKPFVRVATGSFDQSARVPKNSFVHGFLLTDDGKRFTILPLGNPVSGWFGPSREYERTADDAAAHARVGYEKLALDSVAETLLASFPRAIPQWHDEPEGVRWTPTGVLMFARALTARGHGDLALRVVRGARFKLGDGVRDLDVAARAELAHDTMWANVKAFGDPKLPFATLRDRFRTYLELFPKSEDDERARQTLETLETMVAEQIAHDESPKAVESMSQEERVAELVFQLRTQNGQQWSQPGACSIWVDEREEESPAHQLRKLGYDAVPALIEVVDDRRFTRSVGFWRDFCFSHYVLRVGDVANDVLSAITGAEFYHRKSTAGAMVKDGESSEAKRSWRKWWAEFQAKGEKQVLIDSVATTGSVEHAGRLLERYPDEAPPVILAAARKFTEVWLRVGLLGLVGKLSGDEAEGLLREELTQGPALATRMEAARILHARGRAEALDAMIGEWERSRAAVYGRDELIEFLARSCDVRAIAALNRDLDERPPSTRIQVVRAFADVVTRQHPSEPGEPIPPKVRDAVEALAVSRLTDTGRWDGCSMSFNGTHFQNPRVCDMTAFTLNQIWPGRYPAFDTNTSPLQRTRHCIQAANTWRKGQGLEPLPLPGSKVPEPLDAQVAATLIQEVLDAQGADARADALEALATHGLPALPRVRAAIADPRYAGIREALIALDKRLAAIVCSVAFEPASGAAGDPLRQFATGLKCRQLTPDLFVEILTRFCTKMPRGINGLRLGIDREGDGSGIVLSLQWLKGEADLEGYGPGWDYSFYLRAGTEALTGGSGGAAYTYKQEAEGWEDYRAALVDALDSAPGTPIEGYVGLRFTLD